MENKKLAERLFCPASVIKDPIRDKAGFIVDNSKFGGRVAIFVVNLFIFASKSTSIF